MHVAFFLVENVSQISKNGVKEEIDHGTREFLP
jgi:hypothetical protein